VQAFYNEVIQATRYMIDMMVGGALMNKIKDEAYSLAEEMMLNNYHCSNEWTPSKKAGGDLMSML